MSRPLLRRLSDAVCAFQTGHSARDHRRAKLRRILLLSRRLEAKTRRDAERCADGSWTRSRLLFRSDALADAIQRCAEGFDREGEAFLLDALDIECSWIRNRRGNEALDRMGLRHFDHTVDDEAEARWVGFGEFDGKLYQGLFEKGGFDLFLYEKLVRRWDWHVFLHWLGMVFRSWCGCAPESRFRVVQADGPPPPKK